MKAEIKERIDKINRGQVPEGYKKTREGIIPYEWKIEKLGKYVTIHSGDSPSKFKFCSTGVSYFKVDDLNNCDKYLANSELKIDEKDLKKIVPKNSLIFPKRGASILTNKVRILKENSFFDTNLMGIEPNEEKINYEFLYYLILEKGLYKIADTSTIPQLNNKHIEPLLVVLPNVSEQKRIAQVLSTWDKAIELKEKLIEQKKEQKKGLMQRLLTGKVRLPGFEGEWEEIQVKDVCEIGRGRVISKKEIEQNQGIYPVYSSQTSNNGEIGRINTYDYDGEYITWTTDGVNAGTVFYRKGKFNCTNVCGTLKLLRHDIDARYFSLMLQRETDKYVVRHGNPKLMNNVMAIITVRIFNNYEYQKFICDIFDMADREITLLEQEAEALKQQKKGLMQLLLTGKVRVKC